MRARNACPASVPARRPVFRLVSRPVPRSVPRPVPRSGLRSLLCAALLCGCATAPPPPPPVPPTAPQLLRELQPAVEALEVLRWEDLGARVPIELADRFTPLRLRLRWRERSGVRVAPALRREPPACDARAADLQLLGRFTDEKVPTVIEGSTLTSIIPGWMHFITAGVLLPFTLRREHYSRAPERADLQRRVPRALAILDKLGGECAGAHRCEQAFLVPRGAGEITVSLLLSARASWDSRSTLKEGAPLGQLRARVGLGGGAARFTALPAAEERADERCPRLDEEEAPPPRGPGVRSQQEFEADLRRAREREEYPPPLPGAALIEPPPPPEQPATPAESRAARPPWEDGDRYAPRPDYDRRLLAAGTSGDGAPAAGAGSAPRDGAPAAGAGSAPRDGAPAAGAGALRGALLLCELSPDSFGRNDASVELRLGATPPWGSSSAHFAVPLVHLRPGDPVVATVRATTPTVLLFFGGNSYTVTTLRGRYGGGGAFALRDRHASVRCSAVPEPALAEEATRRLRQLGRWLAGHTLAIPRFDPEAQDWGLGSTPVPAARARLRAVASLLGWSDPRLGPYAARIAQMERDFARDRDAHLAALARQAAAAPVQPDGPARSGPKIAARVTALRCEAGRCAAEVTLRNEGKEPCDLQPDRGCGFERPVLLWQGGARGLPEERKGASKAPPRRLEPGESGALQLSLRAPQPGPPLLLGARLNLQTLYLALPPP